MKSFDLRQFRVITLEDVENAVKAGAKAELLPIPGGGHGNFKPEERTKAYQKIREFLAANGLMRASGTGN